jgi:hypothetical protein
VFASAYLTLTSIIQGVALAALVQRVESSYTSFGTASWIMTATTFLGILVIWQEYLTTVMGYVWVPTLLDSVVPFAFVAGEVFMAHFVANDLRNWLLAAGATFLVGVAAWLVTLSQIASGRGQRRGLARTLPLWQRLRGALSGAIGLIGIAGWALYNALGLWRIQVSVAIGMLCLLVGFMAASIPAWNRLAAQSPGD